MKNDFVKLILVLTLICLIISGALAFTNSVTEPIITDAAKAREEAAWYEIIPEADGFTLIEANGLPSTIREVYCSSNNVGYIFIVVSSGYGGDIRIICGIDNDGRMISCRALEHTETKGLGAKITEPQFENQFSGIDEKMEGIVAITGATISSKAYISAIGDAFIAYGLISTNS